MRGFYFNVIEIKNLSFVTVVEDCTVTSCNTGVFHPNMCEAQTLILVKNDSTISGYHLYWLPDLGFLRFSLVD